MTFDRETLRQIMEATAILRTGGLVALPTETVYGLGARADDEKAVARIFEAKGRPSFNPLISHVSGIEMAREYAEFSSLAFDLAGAFWPGALSLVLPKRTDKIAPNVSAGLDTLALRAPAHPMFQEIVQRLGVPIAAPSANLSGRLSPTRADHVRRDLEGQVDYILDGGPTEFGLESTVVSVIGTQVTLLRLGAINKEQIEACLGQEIDEATEKNDAPVSPGQLLKHYAPRTALVLNAKPEDQRAGDLWLGFGDGTPYDLSPSQDLREAAFHLFDRLSTLDALAGADARILVAPIPNQGIGIAINDRLTRAAKRKD